MTGQMCLEYRKGEPVQILVGQGWVENNLAIKL